MPYPVILLTWPLCRYSPVRKHRFTNQRAVAKQCTYMLCAGECSMVVNHIGFLSGISVRNVTAAAAGRGAAALTGALFAARSC